MRILMLIAVCALLGGCASSREGPAVDVSPGQYGAAFAAAKESLAHFRFELDRVDARAGVISTKSKATSGLATPWDTEQSSLGQEVEDLLNRQYRRVRITFEPEEGVLVDDVRLLEGPLVCTVTVSVERLRRPGWRIETTSSRLSSTYLDPEWQTRGMWPTYTVPFAQDHRLAARLAAAIEKRMGEALGDQR
jgi:hypothetical protein